MKCIPKTFLFTVVNSFIGLLLCCLIACNAKSKTFEVIESAEGIAIKEENKAVLFFQAQPKAIKGQFERAGYVHPLYDLQGNELTEDGPADHPHQRGIFWAWHQLLWKGKKVGDSWVSDKVSFKPVSSGAISNDTSVVIHSEMIWKCDSTNKGLIDIINEQSTITVYPVADAYRLIDFDIVLKPLVDSVALGGSDDAKGYGGFSWRIKLPSDLQFQSRADPIKPQETAVTAGPWMSFVGKFNNKSSTGITVFCASPFPGPGQQWILRTAEGTSMQNAVFPGRTPVLLPSGGWQLRYRLVIHDRKLDNEKLETLYKQYMTSLPSNN